MTAQRFVFPYQTTVDSLGVPRDGAQLFSYITGTNAPLPTYSDASASVPNPNPMDADSSGTFGNIFLGPTSVYKFVLEDANGVEIWSADPVESVAVAAGNLVTSVAGKIGAVVLVPGDIGGLGGAATLNVGTSTGTVAAGDDSRINNAVQKDGSVPMTGLLVLAGDPTSALNPTTKQYVDGLAIGLNVKAAVNAASVANVNVASAPASLDGQAGVSGTSRWLLKNQTASAENGIYLFNGTGSALTRTTDMDVWSEVPGSLVFVNTGTVNAGSAWLLTGPAIGAIGTTAIVVSQFLGTGVYQPSNVNLTALAGLAGAADTINYFTGVGTMALTGFTGVARTLASQVTQAAMRTTGLGLGTSATVDTGTSGIAVPLLNASATWSGALNSFQGSAPGATLFNFTIQNTAADAAGDAVELTLAPSSSGRTVGVRAAYVSPTASSMVLRTTNASNETDKVTISNTGAVRFHAYTRGPLQSDASGNISVGNGALATSGAATLNLAINTYYEFTGTNATWTLPLLSGVNSLDQVTIKHMGSGTLTVNCSGSDQIFDASAVSSIDMGPGDVRTFAKGSSTWNLQ